MSKVRINDLAKELEVKSRAILDILPELGVPAGKTHSSSLEGDEAEKVRARLGPDSRQAAHGVGIWPPERAKRGSQDRSFAHLQARRCDEGHSGQEAGRGRRGASRARAGKAGCPACTASQARGARRARRSPGCCSSSGAPGTAENCSAAAASRADYCHPTAPPAIASRPPSGAVVAKPPAGAVTAARPVVVVAPPPAGAVKPPAAPAAREEKPTPAKPPAIPEAPAPAATLERAAAAPAAPEASAPPAEAAASVPTIAAQSTGAPTTAPGHARPGPSGPRCACTPHGDAANRTAAGLQIVVCCSRASGGGIRQRNSARQADLRSQACERPGWTGTTRPHRTRSSRFVCRRPAAQASHAHFHRRIHAGRTGRRRRTAWFWRASRIWRTPRLWRTSRPWRRCSRRRRRRARSALLRAAVAVASSSIRRPKKAR